MKLKLTFSFRILIAATALTACLAAVPAAVQAHKVSIFAYVDGDTVYTLSKFSGGKKVKKGRIEVYDSENNKLLDGLTDDQGEFAFKIPKKAALHVVLVAGTGHKNYWDIPLEEISGMADEPPAGKAITPTVDKQAGATPPAVMDSGALQAAIEKALDRKLKPVMRLLAESQQKGPSLSEILGGIGYIIGLVGIAAYFKSRREK
jgi:nickel transport protein